MSGDQREEQPGLAQWLDGFLFRLETSELNNRWFDVRGSLESRWQLLAGILLGLVAMAAAVGWALGRADPAGPVEARIPLAAQSTASQLVTEAGGQGQGAGGQVGAEVVTGAPGGAPAGGAERPTPAAVTSGSGPDAAVATTDSVAPLIVHVAGEVMVPGLVTVPDGARVNDAVESAGGPTETADLDRLNLAAPLADGMQVVVPAIGDTGNGPYLLGPDGSGQNGGPAGSGPTSAPGPVSLNGATAEILDTLPGVGPATAAAIVAWREENGGFHTVDDLLSVPGIGPAKLAAIRDLVVL